MQFKDDTQLHDIHNAQICYCSNKACNADQIVWVSENMEKPVLSTAVKTLYEIGWDSIEDSDGITHWLCTECIILYKATMQQSGDITHMDTQELASDNRTVEEDTGRKQAQ
jgi:Zn-finger protein